MNSLNKSHICLGNPVNILKSKHLNCFTNRSTKYFDLIRTVGTRAPLVLRLVEGAHSSGQWCLSWSQPSHFFPGVSDPLTDSSGRPPTRPESRGVSWMGTSFFRRPHPRSLRDHSHASERDGNDPILVPIPLTGTGVIAAGVRMGTKKSGCADSSPSSWHPLPEFPPHQSNRSTLLQRSFTPPFSFSDTFVLIWIRFFRWDKPYCQSPIHQFFKLLSLFFFPFWSGVVFHRCAIWQQIGENILEYFPPFWCWNA